MIAWTVLLLKDVSCMASRKGLACKCKALSIIILATLTALGVIMPHMVLNTHTGKSLRRLSELINSGQSSSSGLQRSCLTQLTCSRISLTSRPIRRGTGDAGRARTKTPGGCSKPATPTTALAPVWALCTRLEAKQEVRQRSSYTASIATKYGIQVSCEEWEQVGRLDSSTSRILCGNRRRAQLNQLIQRVQLFVPGSILG